MANSKTQKKRERERVKKLDRRSFFDFKFDEANDASTIKMEGDDSDGNRDSQSRVSGGVAIPSGESTWD